VLRQAVVLVGGLGARSDTPPGGQSAAMSEAMLNVRGRPFIDTLIDEIARYDTFEEILLLAGHPAEPIRARYAGTTRGRSRLSVALEHEPLGTAGALARAADLLQDRFLLFHGDSFFDFNFLDLVSRAESSVVHMALRADIADSRSRRVVLDNDRIHAFVAPDGTAGPVNGGVYVVDRSIIARIGPLPASLERDVLPALASNGAVNGTCYSGYFVDFGVTQDLARDEVELNERLRRPAVFFDRDGVLNQDTGYVFETNSLKWIDGARQAVKAVNDAGYFAFVVSNQSGVARGFFEESDVQALHRWMADEMAAMGAHIDAFEYCPDHPQGTVARYRRVSERRKPAPGMITDLLGRFAVNAEHSILIGDKTDDLEAARVAGLQGYLFSGGNLEAFVKQHLRARSANAPT
jgi:D,D-heptose 1,7-bisphosphate phosphatase